MKYLLFGLMLTICCGTISAQEVYSSSGKPINEKRKYKADPEGFDPSKIIWGGGIILSAGTGYANLGISPILGYRISDRLSAGIGAGFQYLKIKNYLSVGNSQGGSQPYDLKTSIINTNLWARFVVWNNIFLQVQPEINNLDLLSEEIVYAYPASYKTVKKERTFVPSMMVGGGLRQPLSERVSFVGIILYDVLKDKHSPYQGIDLRFGINVGF